ncbi:MAG: DUF1934 domain-containing protein [Eubacterium sp.]|nr:DUF1934 domain-containing protein [Eubacterium sp.]
MSRMVIKIVGTQSIDDEKDEIELTTTGSIEENDFAYIIRYSEQPEPPSAPIDVTVIVKKDGREAEIIRKGAVSSCLSVKKSGRVQCHYGTEYGNILMGITAHEIETSVENGEGSIYLAYDIDINGALASKNDIRLTFSKIQEKQNV